ncbi:Peroxin 13, N-terminal region-domain-containing protein [Chytridium lagenaria]|nr:Peroxin 13, N-terminal region-domain-containing protein [Chytridium lagenaria]
MPSPPKPWERAGAATATTSDTPPITSSLADTSSSTSFQSSSGDAPSIPNRPSTMNSLSRPGGYGSTAYGGLNSGLNSGLGSGYNSGYGSTYGSSLSSPYNRFGSGGYGSSYGSSYGGGYGGYGSSYGSGAYGSRYGAGGYGVGGYGGYGSYGGHGGMNRMGMGGYGAQGGPGMPGPNGELPLTARIEQSTASAFQMIDQIVQAFGGFSQMLESTFFATHSSFMAMVGVAEQFGHLRTYLGRALSIMALLIW